MGKFVVKIGGSILRDSDSFINSAIQINENFVRYGDNVIVVVSAMSGVTDELIKFYMGFQRSLERIEEKYMDVIDEFDDIILRRMFYEELSRLKLIAKMRDKNLSIRDFVLSFGERISKMLMVKALELMDVKTVGLDATEIIKTDDVHGNASINYSKTRSILLHSILPLLREGVIPVLEGFIGSSPGGRITTLGRGGSDYTATTVGALLGVDEVRLVTDVPGIMTADPSHIESAEVVSTLSYKEAAEASYYGCKRLNPKTFYPLLSLRGVKVRIGSWSGGTLVTSFPHRIGPKLVTYRAGRVRLHVAVIGEGVQRVLLDDAIRLLRVGGVRFEGFYTFDDRPSLVFLFKDEEELPVALNILHQMVAGWVR